MLNVIKEDGRTLVDVDFRGEIDVHVVIEIAENSFKIETNAYGDRYFNEDPGFKLFGGDEFPFIDLKDEYFLNSELLSIVHKVRCSNYLQVKTLIYCINHLSCRQLFESNYALFMLAISKADKEGEDEDSVVELLSKKRKVISNLTTTNNTEEFVKFLSKVEFSAFSSGDLNMLIRISEDIDLIESFRHWQRIPSSILHVCENNGALKGSGILLDLARNHFDKLNYTESHILASTLNKKALDTINLGEKLNIKTAEKIVRGLTAVRALDRLHDKWLDLYLNSRKRIDPDVYFPKPRFPYPREIEWIGSVNGLKEEGEIMNHCIATYSERCVKGESFIFKLYEPERTTLELIDRGTRVSLKESKILNNQDPCLETKKFLSNLVNSMNDDYRDGIKRKIIEKA